MADGQVRVRCRCDDIDVTGAEAFETLEEWLRDQEVALAFSRVQPAVKRRLDELGLFSGQPVFDTNRSAILALAGAAPDPQASTGP